MSGDETNVRIMSGNDMWKECLGMRLTLGLGLGMICERVSVRG